MTKAISVFLVEDDVIVATIAGWNGKVTKMSREKFKNLSTKFPLLDNLNKEGGIYFLLGKGTGYVGQASISENGIRNVIKRVSEHKKEDFWDEVIMLTAKGLGASDLNFLENSFYHLMKNANVLKLYQTEPSLGYIPIANQISGEIFIENIKNIFTAMGINFLTSSKQKKENENAETAEQKLLHVTLRGTNAICRKEDGKYIVLQGSRVALTPTDTCPDSAKRDRETYKDKITANGILAEDISFSTPSGASNFVCLASTSGYDCWKYADGSALKKPSGTV